MGRLSNSYAGSPELERIRNQTNTSPQLQKLRTGNKLPTDMRLGDSVISLHQRGAMITLPGDKGQKNFIIPQDSAKNLGTQFGTGIPTTDAFPNDGDYGWWIDDGAGDAYWSLNVDGVIYYTTSTVTGITFAAITGTISNAQHGTLGRTTDGNPANPHHTNATTSQAGFLSTTFFDLLDGATASATNNALVRRNGTGGASFSGTLVAATVTASATITSTAGDIVSTAGDVIAGNNISAAGNIGANGICDILNGYQIGGTNLFVGFDAGWTSPSGSVSRGGFNTATVGIVELAENVKGLIDAMLADQRPGP